MAEVSTLKSEIVDQCVLNFLAQPQSRKKGQTAPKCLAVKNPGPRFVENPGPRFVENPGPRLAKPEIYFPNKLHQSLSNC